jgi:hypothetical protein
MPPLPLRASAKCWRVSADVKAEVIVALAVAFVVGFALGYAVRAAISFGRRRAAMKRRYSL